MNPYVNIGLPICIFLIIYVVYYLITIQLYKDCPPKEKIEYRIQGSQTYYSLGLLNIIKEKSRNPSTIFKEIHLYIEISVINYTN